MYNNAHAAPAFILYSVAAVFLPPGVKHLLYTPKINRLKHPGVILMLTCCRFLKLAMQMR